MAIFNSYVCLPEGTGIMEFSTRIIPNRLNVGRSWISEMGFTLCRGWEPIESIVDICGANVSGW